MKKIFSLLMVAFMATAIVSCDKEESSSSTGSGSSSGSGSAELANTTWSLDEPYDETYGTDVLYWITFGPTNQLTFSRNVNGSTVVMGGTYDYANGSGTAYLKYVLGGPQGDNNEYRHTFTVSGNTLNFNLSGRTIALQKQD